MRRFILGAAIAAVASGWPALASAGDKQVSQQIADSLKSSGRLVNYNIGVTYEEGAVYLKGRVASQEQMREAIDLTYSMPGVTEVVSQLTVEPSSGPAVRAAVAPQGDAQHAMFPEPATPSKSDGVINGLVDKFETALAPKKTTPTRRAAAQTPVGVPSQVQQTAAQQVMPAAQQMPQMQMPPQMQSPGQFRGAAPAAMHPAAAQMAAMPGAPGMMPASAGGYMGPRPVAYPGGAAAGVAPVSYDQPYMPNYAWPSYATYPNYAGLTYPKQYSATAWPYIGPFYPYPQVPLGWRKVSLEWDDGWWWLDFRAKHKHH